jgi:hypothetical protein
MGRTAGGFFLQMICNRLWVCLAGGVLLAGGLRAQEPPYFVTYSDALEEPGNLEIAYKGVNAAPKDANGFNSATMEFEYGLKAWWTTEIYLNGQATQNDSTVFTGFRWENRFRPLMRNHWINPVLYAEFENINGADKSFLEVVNHDSIADLYAPNAEARAESLKEMELKLILSSNVRGWNISENFVFEKVLNHSDPWEFGYALGVSRPLALAAGSRDCVFCRENFLAGAEMYGGLGTTEHLGLNGTSHYLGPILQLNIPKGPAIAFEPSFGLNSNSVGVLWRFKISYEVEQIFGRLRHTER